MAKTVDVLKSLCEPHLEPGEEFLGGTRVNQKGMAKAAAGFGIGGAIGGGIAAAATSKNRAAQTDAGFPTTPQLAFGLTDRRLLVFNRSVMSGKPKDLLASVALAEIASSHFEPAKLVPKLHLVLTSGAEVGFEAIKLDKPEEFAAILGQLLALRPEL